MGDGTDWILVKGSGRLWWGGWEEAQVIIMEMNVGLGWGRGPAAGRALLNMEPLWSDQGPEDIDRLGRR